MHSRATNTVLSAKQTGITQYETFVADRITSNKVLLTDSYTSKKQPCFNLQSC